MSASPVPGSGGDDASLRPISLTRWLRQRSDRELATLLGLRPDLALPAPHDLAALAVRLGVRTSTQRAVDGLDAHGLRALETIVLAAGDDDTVDAPEVDGLDELFALALVWGAPDLVHLAPNVRDSLGTYPGGLGRPAAWLYRHVSDATLVPVMRSLGLPPAAQPRAATAAAAVLGDPARLAELIDACDAQERDILDRLAAGPPVGTVRSVRADDSAPGRLMTRGLLVPIDSLRVELPREVGLAVRAGGDAPPSAEPPPLRSSTRSPDELDQLGTTAVREFVRLTDVLADVWTAQAPPLLRSGGVGVRELRRTAKAMGVDEATVALVAEVAYAAGLINATTGIEPVYLPSTDYDAWTRREPASRWIALATAWLAMTRQPSLVNQRGDRDRVVGMLGPDVERGTTPALRRQVLDVLTALPPGAAPTDRADVLARLAWQQPRRAGGTRPLAEAVLTEADRLGVTAAGGVTGWTRTLLASAATGVVPAPGSAAAAEHALDRALPAPVDHFLVQPDLTVVVPGPPDRAVATELALVADLESTGGASVYRITDKTVRRALDAGRSAPLIRQFFTQRSRTPVPQALDYLIEDAARRHGVLRAGSAGSYLRCDDAALLARVVADRAAAGLGLRLLAPTVLVAEVSITRVLDVLREAGYAPAAESADGDVVTLTAEPARAPNRPPVRVVSARGVASEVQLAEVVRRMRAGDEAIERGARATAIAAQVPGVTSAATMELLRRAVRESRPVLLGCAEQDGSTGVHTLTPISLAAGAVRGWEEGRAGLVAYPVHRITSISLLEEIEDA